MIWRAVDGIVAFLARGLIAAEGELGVAGGRIGTIAALSINARVLRVGASMRERPRAVMLR
jgi:hypothetical protein